MSQEQIRAIVPHLALAPQRFTIVPTFSHLPRWFDCQLGDVLAQADEPSGYADKGNARHRFFQRITELMQDPKAVRADAKDPDSFRAATLEEARELALAEADAEHTAMLAAIPVDSPAFRFDTVAAEVALALDLETGAARELGRGIDRDYTDRRPTEVVGTIDRLGAIGTDGGYVGDYKGRSFKGSPAKNAQFLAAALAAARIHRWSWVEIEVLVQIGDEVYPRKEKVDLVQLDAFELELQERRALAVQNVEAFLSTGRLPPATVASCCDYCPSLRFCPARGAIVREVLDGRHEVVTGLTLAGEAYLDDQLAAEARRVKGLLEDTVEKIGEVLKDYGRRQAFPLNDGTGRWYGIAPDAKTRELGAGVKVAEVLAELFGAEAARAGVKVEGTLGGIESAVKAYIAAETKAGRQPELLKKGSIKTLREKAEAKLAERGLLVTRLGGDPKVFKPKEA